MRKIYSLTVALLLGGNILVNAQTDSAAAEAPAPLSLSGSVDAYFRANLNADRAAAPTSSFANQPGFAVGMANLILSKEYKKSGFVGDLVFGPRGDQAVFKSSDPTSPLFGGTGNPAIVNQLFVYYKPTEKFKISLGKFNTFVGFEVISPVGNANYSTSYLFSYGPFNHTGLKAQYQITDKVSALLAVMNPTDFTDFNPFNTYSFGGQLGYSTEKGSAYLNVIYGDQDGKTKAKKLDAAQTFLNGDTIKSANPLFQVDLTTGRNIGEKFYLGLNASYNGTSGTSTLSSDSLKISETKTTKANGYYGVAIYPRITVSDNFTVALRAEYFAEINGGYGALKAYDKDGKASVVAFTLSPNIKFGKLTVIPELRYDEYSEKWIPKDGKFQKSIVSALVAAVYAF
jgi:hypothetical protein